jgi:hypothetical protein
MQNGPFQDQENEESECNGELQLHTTPSLAAVVGKWDVRNSICAGMGKEEMEEVHFHNNVSTYNIIQFLTWKPENVHNSVGFPLLI